jgi:hypothetical protein
VLLAVVLALFIRLWIGIDFGPTTTPVPNKILSAHNKGGSYNATPP